MVFKRKGALPCYVLFGDDGSGVLLRSLFIMVVLTEKYRARFTGNGVQPGNHSFNFLLRTSYFLLGLTLRKRLLIIFREHFYKML